MEKQVIKEVLKVVNEYIDATYKANIEDLENSFHEKARMAGYLGEELVLGSPEHFINDIKSNPSMESTNAPYKVDIKSINVMERVASVVVLERGFFGEIVIETYFHLIKIDGEWKIISKTFTTIEK